MSDTPRTECCGGTCRLAEIQRMSQDELVEALINAEEERDMAMAEVDRLSALRVAGPDDLLIRLTADQIAWHVGDTFINWETMPPNLQWVRILRMLREALAATEGEET